MNKICPKCNKSKLVSEFNKHKIRGTQTYCSDCSKQRDREDYQQNKNNRKYKVRENNKRYRKEASVYINEVKKSSKCCVCNENCWVCLDFHHLEDDKEFNIADGLRKNKTINKIKKEIDKCVVLCSNCHRKLHAGLISGSGLIGKPPASEVGHHAGSTPVSPTQDE